MDAVQQFAETLGVAAPKTFLIAGASKVCPSLYPFDNVSFGLFECYSVAGPVSSIQWFLPRVTTLISTAWTTAAVDNERVTAAVPIVMDILNLQRVRDEDFQLPIHVLCFVRLEFSSPFSSEWMTSEKYPYSAAYDIVSSRLDICLQRLLWTECYSIRRSPEPAENGRSCRSIQLTIRFLWTLANFCSHFIAGYFERYKNMKILQIQSSGDEFFLPDNEVRRESIIISWLLRLFPGCFLEWPTDCHRRFLPQVRETAIDASSNQSIIDVDD